jgi:hypothetical protein
MVRVYVRFFFAHFFPSARRRSASTFSPTSLRKAEIPNARSAIAFGSAGNTLDVQLQRLGHARVVRHEIAPLAAGDPHLALHLRHVICRHSAQQRLNVDRAVVRALDLDQSVPVH